MVWWQVAVTPRGVLLFYFYFYAVFEQKDRRYFVIISIIDWFEESNEK